METYNVAFSNVRAVGYDAESQTLEVEFLSGRRYQYYEVPKQIHEKMMLAPSKGRYLNSHIKDQYPYSRVE